MENARAQEKLITISESGKASAAALGDHYPLHPLGTINADHHHLILKAKQLYPRPAVQANFLPPFIPSIPSPGYYPGDLGYDTLTIGTTVIPGGGRTVTSAQFHNVYVNPCTTPVQACWGNPSQFLDHLGKSDMIHIADHYVGATSNDRYTVGTGGTFIHGEPSILYDSDMEGIAYAAASQLGAGYGHIYHIFLPPGQDVCFAPATATSPLECYSPDNLATFDFCAYHSSFDSNVGHVLYTVEPYQNVPGCQVQAPSPNGLLTDSTADVLSHETFETITDPDGDAWFNRFSLDLFGYEVADECQNYNFGYGSVNLHGRKYEIQPEYSNTLHGCSYSPYGFFWLE
jgi:hypothetical protein